MFDRFDDFDRRFDRTARQVSFWTGLMLIVQATATLALVGAIVYAIVMLTHWVIGA
jgi:hypothetical protein